MAIRKAVIEDLPKLVEIYNQAVLTKRCTADMETFEVEEKVNWFNSHMDEAYPLYVYEENDNVIGYVHLSGYRPGRRAMKHIAEVSYYIHDNHHRKGIGSQMMTFIINEAKSLGYRDLLAILLSWNIGSIKLLEKFGFEEWGNLPDIADFDGDICSHLYYGLKL